MAKEIFKVCARYAGELTYDDKTYCRFIVVGSGSLVHIPIEKVGFTPNMGAFYLLDVYPRNKETENYLQFRIRCELTLPRYAEPLA